jgi:transposase InsO family protein
VDSLISEYMLQPPVGDPLSSMVTEEWLHRKSLGHDREMDLLSKACAALVTKVPRQVARLLATYARRSVDPRHGREGLLLIQEELGDAIFCYLDGAVLGREGTPLTVEDYSLRRRLDLWQQPDQYAPLPDRYSPELSDDEISNEYRARRAQDLAYNVFSELGADAAREGWLVDSGCTAHMTPDAADFVEYSGYSGVEPRSARFVGGVGGSLAVAGRGTVKVFLPGGEKLVLRGVLHVPGVPDRLLSVSKLHADGHVADLKNSELHLHGGARVCLDLDERKMWVLRGERGHVPRAETALRAAAAGSAELWHQRLGHLHGVGVRQLLKTVGHGQLGFCEACAVSKSAQQPRSTAPQERSAVRLSKVHMDIWEMRTVSLGGCRYAISFVDDCTGVIWLRFMRVKNMALRQLCHWYESVVVVGRFDLRSVRCDNDGVFVAEDFRAWCRSKGIALEFSAPYSQWQNGRAERAWRSLSESAKSMLTHAGLDNEFWVLAMQCAAYVRNRVPSAGAGGAVPYTLFHGVAPKLDRLRVFGCPCYVHVDPSRRLKMEDKSRRGVFVGYSTESKAYHVWMPDTRRVVTSRNVVFNETWRSPPAVVPAGAELEEEEDDEGEPDANASEEVLNQEELPEDEADLHPAVPPTEADLDPVVPPTETPAVPAPPQSTATDLRSWSQNYHPPAHQAETAAQPPRARTRGAAAPPKKEWWKANQKQGPAVPHAGNMAIAESRIDDCQGDWEYPKNYGPFHWEYHKNYGPGENDLCAYSAYSGSTVLKPKEPASLGEARKSSEWPQWKEATNKELESLSLQGVWEEVALPPGARALGCHWILKYKYDKHGGIERYKARLVVGGHRQLAGEFGELFAPVVKYTSIRMVLSLTSELGWELEQMDVDTAFLYAPLEEEVYMRLPEGYEKLDQDGKPLVARLLKSLYGLKQSPRNWNTHLDAWLVESGWVQTKADPGVYFFETETVKYILLLYVDDLVIAGPDIEWIKAFKEQVKEKFKIKDLGAATWLLGMEVTRDRAKRQLRLSQAKYINDLLSAYNMQDCNAAKVPMLPGSSVVVTGQNILPNPKLYQSLVGSLLYAAVSTRPDIVQAVSKLARVMSKPEEEHWVMAKRVLRYLKGKPDVGLTYTAGTTVTNQMEHATNALIGYSDADWAGDLATRRSTTGYVFMLNGAAISWNSKLQPTVALSTAEAEYMAMCAAIQEGVFLRKLLHEVGFPQSSTPMLEDNQGCIALGNNPITSSRSKHIDIKYHFVREMVNLKEFVLKYCPTDKMLADPLTKPLPEERHNELCLMMQGHK